MKHKALLFFFFLSLQSLFAIASEDVKKVGRIQIKIETLQRNEHFNSEFILSHLRTKVGDPFSQHIFDQDLKTLSEEYDRVEPTVDIEENEVNISLKLWQRPTIRSIKWIGNTQISTKTLQKKLNISPGTTFKKDVFNDAFSKVKEYYIKKGYFESHLQYKMIPTQTTNEIDIEIYAEEGRSGRIGKIVFYGFDKKEESELLSMINTKKYQFFTSWLSGSGTYRQEALDHDKLLVINFLHNRGYADARVNIKVTENERDHKIKIEIDTVRGQLYHYGKVSFSGNSLFTDEEIEKVLIVHPGDTYSPDQIRDSSQNIKDLYGRKGYIETSAQFTTKLVESEPLYNLHFQIDEGKQFRIGLIRVLGNTQTNTHVILRESYLVPGEVFDSARLKATQRRLEAIGYFKSVNVYTIRSTDHRVLGENYRDVIIEVEETTTGNISLFFGLSTTEDLFGGLDLTENNFNYKGLFRLWKEGLKAVRGGGEYAHARVTIGQKQRSYLISWFTPYFRDSLWRVGFDVNYSQSNLQSEDYNINSVGASIFGSYPLGPYITWGLKQRFRNSNIHIDKHRHKKGSKQVDTEERNSGIVLGLSSSLSYDSTDNAFKPHRGTRSSLEAEAAGVRRHSDDHQTFPFLKLTWVNTYYYPVWRKGTFKARADFKFLSTLGQGDPEYVPLSERFFLGGENSVRGYRPFRIGPLYNGGDPTGGVSSILFSVEYLQEIFRLLDIFTFFDAGSISMHNYDVKKFNMSAGVGARIDIGNRVPFIVGIGFPINPDNSTQVQKVFFTMGGNF